MRDLILRPATAADITSLGALAIQTYLDTYATEGIRPALAREVLARFAEPAVQGWLQHPGSRVVVAERADHLIGFAHTTLDVQQPLARARHAAELERLYVQQPFAAQGVGSRLIEDAEAAAAASGADLLWLSCWVHNLRALRFYAKHRYEDLGNTWYRVEGEQHENRVLAKPLPATPAR